MRRTPADPYLPISFKPFFWRTCTSCGDQCRRERGWLIRYPGANHRVFEKFLCNECAPTLEVAQKFQRTRDYRFTKPTMNRLPLQPPSHVFERIDE